MIHVKRELRLGIGVLLATQLLMAFAAIGLLSRMAPVIDRILQENVTSIQAAEDMLVVLALSRGESLHTRGLDGQFFGALTRARDALSEDAESEILGAVERGYRSLGPGAEDSLPGTLNAVQEFVRINRDAMHRTRDRASRLSEAGAWAAVLMALIGFAAGLVVAIVVLFPYNAFRAQMDRTLGRIETLIAAAGSREEKKAE